MVVEVGNKTVYGKIKKRNVVKRPDRNLKPRFQKLFTCVTHWGFTTKISQLKGQAQCKSGLLMWTTTLVIMVIPVTGKYAPSYSNHKVYDHLQITCCKSWTRFLNLWTETCTDFTLIPFFIDALLACSAAMGLHAWVAPLPWLRGGGGRATSVQPAGCRTASYHSGTPCPTCGVCRL